MSENIPFDIQVKIIKTLPVNIPFDIQVKIMKRLPVKSLLQFRTVSKAWKSVIDSPRFIARYSGQQHHLLVSYNDESLPGKKKYVSLVDDETFPHQKVSLTLPQRVAMLLTRSGGPRNFSMGVRNIFKNFRPLGI
ncbi:putative F-box domain-containing protein [Helianthus annuus]|nr:putative F-box domain-containing protein [Helianthus annuus]